MQVFISNKEIYEIADALVRTFSGGSPPLMVDIDEISARLCIPVMYETFAEDEQDKVGYLSDGVKPLNVWKDKMKTGVVFPKNTIVLDRFLLRSEEETRRRFVLAHEIAHKIINSADPTCNSACFDRIYDSERNYSFEELQNRLSFEEAQANALAAAILMPKFMIHAALKKFHAGKAIPVYGDAVFLPRTKTVLLKISGMLGVSHTALLIQLRKYGLLEAHDMTEYIEKNLIIGGVK
ncbi:MAG: ImmA/IrrE family metallo-endopeptidase [Eubacteriales bacterium]|nr:ImmA/IrrE family metallo-endopeptidase [Eubacteriales bacterium]